MRKKSVSYDTEPACLHIGTLLPREYPKWRHAGSIYIGQDFRLFSPELPQAHQPRS